MRRSWMWVCTCCGVLILPGCKVETAPTGPEDAQPSMVDADAAKPPDQPRGEAARAEDAHVDDEGPTIAEALGDDAEPTEPEFKAWDRKDPAAEKHLYQWDRDNLDRMPGYFEDLQCFRHQTITAGDSFAAGTSSDAEWMKFKRAELEAMDRWMKELLAKEPRILEKSKFIGSFLEAHELVMMGYTRAYNEGDEDGLAMQNARWRVIEAKVRKYVESLGGKLESLSATDCVKRSKND